MRQITARLGQGPPATRRGEVPPGRPARREGGVPGDSLLLWRGWDPPPGQWAWAECALLRGRRGDVSICRICDHLHPDHAELGQAAWELEPANQKTKADLEHVLSEIAGMRVVLPERAG